MSDEYSIRERIKDIINGEVDYDRQRKASMKGWIDRADTIFQFGLVLFFVAFFIIMIAKYFL